MNDGFEPLERGVIAEHAGGQFVAINLAGGSGPRKRRLDRRHRLALVKPMHHGIGIMHGHAFLDEEARRGRFSHAERAGQAKDEHAASTNEFSAGVVSTLRSENAIA